MQIKKIHIQNFKSLVDFELDSPKQFCAFVGPNASGKSNIFEALEFVNYVFRFRFSASTFFGTSDDIVSFTATNSNKENNDEQNPEIVWQNFYFDFDSAVYINFAINYLNKTILDGISTFSQNAVNIDKPYIDNLLELKNINYRREIIEKIAFEGKTYENEFEVFIDNFSRIFVGKPELIRINGKSPKLKTDASNLAQILWQIFQDENKKEDFIDWLRILIPEFEDIVVKQSNIDDSHEFFVKEKGSEKPFPRRLLSDGTKNILALMAAVYQSNEPQFLCIEEPENGLHPYAIEMLVDFFRDKCETEGHHIWLNTHSQTLVRSMKIDELVLVNKIDGRTQAKRVEGMNGLDIKTDEAWLTNALGGGVLWSK